MSPHPSQLLPHNGDHSDLDDDLDDFYVSGEFPAAQKSNHQSPMLVSVSHSSIQRRPQQVYSHDLRTGQKSPTFRSFPLPSHAPGISGRSNLVVLDL